MEFLKPYVEFADGVGNVHELTESRGSSYTANQDISGQCRSVLIPEPSTSTQLTTAEPVSSPSPCTEVSTVDKVIKFLQDRKHPQELDAMEHLFMGLAKTVQKFSPKRQSLVKMKIMQIIMDNELQHLDELACNTQIHSPISHPNSEEISTSNSSASNSASAQQDFILENDRAEEDHLKTLYDESADPFENEITDTIQIEYDLHENDSNVALYYSSFNPTQ